MTGSLVLRRDLAGVAHLRLHRPEAHNALTPAMFVELRRHVDAIADDGRVGAVVLSGSGPSFCAGHDLPTLRAGDRGPTPTFAAETIDALEALPQPTVARLHGRCLGGGLALALGCDLLIAATRTELGDTHGRWGLAPTWGMSVRLPERVGVGRAKELLFTSRRVSATQAATMGLVDHVVADERLDATIASLTTAITANSWGTNRIAKSLLARRGGLSRDEALRFERALPFGMPGDMQARLGRG